jgi:hypothetical protein
VVCDGGAPVAEAEAWVDRGADGSLRAYECLPGYCVAGGACGANRKPAAQNPLCGECADGFYQWGAACVSCEGASARGGGLLFLLSLLLVALVWAVHRLSQRAGSEFKMAVYCVQIALLLVGDAESAGASVLQLLNLDALSVAGGSCLAPISQHTRMLLAFLPQPVAWVALGVVALLEMAVRRLLLLRRGARSQEEEDGDGAEAAAAEGERGSTTQWVARGARFCCGAGAGGARVRWVEYRRSFVALFLMTFNATAVATFNYLNCVRVTLADAELHLVFAHPAVSCDSHQYRAWLWLPALALAELAALTAWVGWKLRRSQRKASGTVSAFSLLREPYKPAFYWWELVGLARRTLIVAIVVFMAGDRAAQLLGVTLACLAALLLHNNALPYKEEAPPFAQSSDSCGERMARVLAPNRLELAVLCYHLVLAAALNLAARPYGPSTSSALAAAVFIPALLMMAAVALRVLRRLRAAGASDKASGEVEIGDAARQGEGSDAALPGLRAPLLATPQPL